MNMNYEKAERTRLLKYLEQKRRNIRRDDFGMLPTGVTINVADLVDSSFIRIGDYVFPLLEQFEEEGLIEISQRPLHGLSWRPTMHDRVDGVNAYFIKILPKFQEVLNQEFYGKASKQIHQAPYTCGELAIDLDKGTLSYGKNESIEISRNTREMKFLILLLDRSGSTVEYWEFAKALDLPTYRTNNNDNQRYARDVQATKRDVVKNVLKKAGMEADEIDSIIHTKTKAGYVLRCPLM